MKTIFILLSLFFVTELIAADQWEQLANLPGVGRHRGQAFAIKDKGYMGFGHINSVVNIDLADVWEFDPATNSWTQKSDFGGGPRYHNLVFSVGNKGYSGGGRNASGGTFNDLWEFDPATNIWTQLNDYPAQPRIGALSFIIDDVAYCGLGTGGSDDQKFWKYDPSTDSWQSIANFPGVGRATGVAFALGGKGYVGTGSGSFGTGNDFWEYKPSSDQWVQRATVPGLTRQGATAFAVNGRGYIFCGNNWSEDFDDVWEFNPGDNTWKQMDDFPGLGRRFMYGFVIHDKGYCGTGTTGTNLNDFWRFDPLGVPEGKYLRTRIEVNAFPNPSTEYINFEIPQETLEHYTNLELIILDAAGRTLYQTPFYENIIRFERGRNLHNGVYFYQISAADELLKSGKFIFQ
jgi:N-acetylneuraminic acid mutarotase